MNDIVRMKVMSQIMATPKAEHMGHKAGVIEDDPFGLPGSAFLELKLEQVKVSIGAISTVEITSYCTKEIMVKRREAIGRRGL
jgi:hypothetical protein